GAAGIVEARTDEQHACSEGAAPVHLHERGEARHHDANGDAEALPVEREAERMVPGGRGHHPAAPRFGIEAEQRVACAPLFEAPRDLLVHVLEQTLHSALLAGRCGSIEWGAENHATASAVALPAPCERA